MQARLDAGAGGAKELRAGCEGVRPEAPAEDDDTRPWRRWPITPTPTIAVRPKIACRRPFSKLIMNVTHHLTLRQTAGKVKFSPHYLLWNCPAAFINTTECQVGSAGPGGERGSCRTGVAEVRARRPYPPTRLPSTTSLTNHECNPPPTPCLATRSLLK